MLTGCGGGESPEQAVTNALKAIKNLNMETAKKYFEPEELTKSDSKNDLLENEKNTKLLLKNFSFKVLSSSIEGDTATVKTEITNTDLKLILSEYLKQAFASAFSNAFSGELSDEDIQKQSEQMFFDLLKREGNKTLTSNIDIKLMKKEDSWRIIMDEYLQDAIFGGLISAMKGLGVENSSPKDKLIEIQNYVVGDIWNYGFADISWYLTTGKSSTGETIDIDLTLQQLDDTMEKKPDYDAYIRGLEDAKYGKVKQMWEKLSTEIDKLYSQVKEKKPTANDSNYDFDTGLFQQYMDAFIDSIDKLNE